MRIRLTTPAALLLALLCNAATLADVRLPRIFTSHMVVQQELPIRMWGWADAGERVTVSFAGQSESASADNAGRWLVTLKPMKADGKSHTLTVKGKNAIRLTNVVLGEVWIAAGQSNMNRRIDIRKEDRPDMRLYWIDFSTTPRQHDLNKGVAGWVESTPDGLASAAPVSEGRDAGKPRIDYTEVGYVFGRRLHEDLGVPVGLIRAAVGGSTAKAWTPDPTNYPSKYPFDTEVERKRYIAHQPGLLYYSMIKGLGPLSVRGVVWYQGEDDGRNRNYAADFSAMINAWRNQFQRDDLPFYYVQIAQTTYASGMLRVWEAQQRVMRDVPNTGLAVSNDIYVGTTNGGFKLRADKDSGRPIAGGSNPHPPNKQLVANRLADIALAKTYGKLDREVFGPVYKSHRVEGDKVFVTFDHVGAGLKASDGEPLNWFELSDGTKEGRKLKYVRANARIVNKDTIVVTSNDVKSPKHVRFGWHPLVRHNLVNSVGLPGVSFRTDDVPF